MTLVQRLVVLVAVVLGPATVVEVYNAGNLETERAAQLRDEASRLVAAVRLQESEVVTATDDVLMTAAVDAAASASDAAACTALQTRLAARSKRWLRVLVTDAAGVVRCAPDRFDLGVDMTAHPEVARALAGSDRVVGDFVDTPLVSRPYLPVARAWRDGEKRGVVLAEVDLHAVGATFASMSFPVHAALAIADRSGRVVVAGPVGGGAIGEMLPLALRPFLNASTPGVLRMRWTDGTLRVVGYSPTSSSAVPGSFLAVGIPEAPAMAPLRRAAARTAILFALTWMIATALAWWGGEVLVRRPIRTLAEAADRLREGDLSARVNLGGRTELARLGAAFDRMAGGIQESEARATESGRLLEALVESTPDMVSFKDKDGRILVANSSYLSVYRLKREDVIGRLDYEVVPMHVADQVVRIRREVTETGLPGVFDIVTRDGAGGERHHHVIYSPVKNERGEITHVSGIGRDVTEMRAAEERQRAAREAAEEAGRSKTRFLAAASHDLRQPLQGALLFADAAVARVQGPPDAVDALQRLSLALLDLKRLTDSLMDVSRLESGALEADVSEFAVQPLLERLVAGSMEAAAAKGLAVSVVGSAALVRSDPLLLGRMIGNLVENAVRYTERGRVLVDCVPAGNRLRIEVRDSGPGISKPDLERIWEEFQQLHRNPERDRRQGFGLGLSIVRRLADLLDHRVVVQSEEGVGSCFTVEVPIAGWAALPAPASVPAPINASAPRRPAEVASEPASPVAVRPEPPSLAAGPRIADERVALVIEDDEAIMTGLRIALADYGYRVVGAENGDEAVHAVEAGAAPEFIVADYRLRNGETGDKALARARGAAARPVSGVLLTGEIGPEPAAAAASLGIPVLRKPIGVKALLQAVATQGAA